MLQTFSFLKIIKGGEVQTEIFLNKMINKLWIKKDFILRRGLQILILLTNLEHRVFGTFSRKKTAVHLDFVQMRGGGGPVQIFCHLFINAFLVNKRSLFPPKYQ